MRSCVGFRVVYLRHSGTQHFSRFRSKPGFQGDESYCYAPPVISVSICPSVFAFMIHPNNTRKFFARVSYAGSPGNGGFYVLCCMHKEAAVLGGCKDMSFFFLNGQNRVFTSKGI